MHRGASLLYYRVEVTCGLTHVLLHAGRYTSEERYSNDGQPAREAYEALLIAHGVNAVFSGHVHTYERTHPVENLRIVPAGRGIVHVTVGTSGAALYGVPNVRPAWSAFRASMYGHAELTVANATHAHIEVWSKLVHA